MAQRNAVPSISQTNFRLDIPNISALDEDGVLSPEITVFDIPWNIRLYNETAGKKAMLAVFLLCQERLKPPNWSCIAHVKFKLLSFNGDQNAVAFELPPHIFQRNNAHCRTNLMKWQDLFDATKNYVKDDAIRLEIAIEVANPNDANKSELILDNIDKCCNTTGSATFRLTVNNIENLWVVRSSNIILRNSEWFFDVCKHSGYLLVYLHNIHTPKEFSCKVQLLVKLISSKPSVEPIEQTRSVDVKKRKFIKTRHLISWDKLLKSENGFVNNDSIVIEIEVKASKPEGVASNSRKRKASEPLHRKLGCVICLDEIGSQENVSVTNCGHLFCSPCIRENIARYRMCPLCKTPTSLDQLKRVYLPFVD